MKKLLLFSFALCGMTAAIAQNAPHLVKLGPVSKTTAKITNANLLTSEYPQTFSQAVLNGPSSTSRISNSVHSTSFSASLIISTSYQLQTNGSVRNALVQNSDGSLSTAWTYSPSASAPTWNDRGTGYNYFDGSVWLTGPGARIETVRTGFTNIAVTTSGKEHILAHSPTSTTNPMCYSSRPVKGTGLWTENQNPILSPTGPGGTLFPRMASGGTNGISLHAISVTTGTVFPNGVKYQGQDGALVYARSTDDGVTWSSWSAPSQLDTTNGFPGYPNGGDCYAIDARGNTVAYVVGNFTSSTVLMKSLDNGTTWTKTVIKAFPIPRFLNQISDTDGNGSGDTIYVADGAYDVVIDASNNAHVFFGRSRMLETDTAVGWSFFPVTDGLYYWDETMTPGHPRIIAGVQDIDLNGTFDLPSPTPSTDTPFGIYDAGMTSHPSCGIDAAGKLFVLYDAPIENTDGGNGHAFRNIYAMGSTDGGATWSTPYRIRSDDFVEQVYPNIAPHFTGNCIPVTYQEDLSYGNGLTKQASGNVDPFNVFADIDYGCLLESEVLASTNEIPNNLFKVSDNFPNPFHGSTSVSITMNKASMVTLDIYSPLGAKVAATTSSELSSGEHTMTIDGSKLSAGIYFYTVRAGEFMVTKKMIIE